MITALIVGAVLFAMIAWNEKCSDAAFSRQGQQIMTLAHAIDRQAAKLRELEERLRSLDARTRPQEKLTPSCDDELYEYEYRR